MGDLSAFWLPVVLHIRLGTESFFGRNVPPINLVTGSFFSRAPGITRKLRRLPFTGEFLLVGSSSPAMAASGEEKLWGKRPLGRLLRIRPTVAVE